MRKFVPALLLCACGIAQNPQSQSTPQQRPAASATEAMYQQDLDSAERKVAYLTQNAIKAHPDARPTVLTEREVNAYLNSPKDMKLPKGVSHPKLTGSNNEVTANATVDFDAVTEGKSGGNPLMRLFSGTHDVVVNANGVGIRGEGRVHVNSVSIDGITVPKAALEYFVDKYIKPKYPDLGIDSRFDLPARVDSAVIGNHQLTVIQK